MNVNVGKFFFYRPANINVKVTVHPWWKSCLYTNFCCSKRMSFSGTPYNFFSWKKVAFLFPKVSAEGAESALLYADIGEIYVPVNHISDCIPDCPPAQLVGYCSYQIHFKAAAIKKLYRSLYRDFLVA